MLDLLLSTELRLVKQTNPAEMPPKQKGPLYLGGAAPRVALDVAEAIREEPEEEHKALEQIGNAAEPAGQPLRLSKADFRRLPQGAKDLVERHPFQPPQRRRKSAAEEKKATESRIQAAIRLLLRHGYRVIAPSERKGNGGPLPPPPRPPPPLPPAEDSDEDQFGPGEEEEDGTLERLQLEMKMDWRKNTNALLGKLERLGVEIPKAIETAMRAVAGHFPAKLRGNSQRLNELEEGADGILVWVALQIDPYLPIPDKEHNGVTAKEPTKEVLKAAQQAIAAARAVLQPEDELELEDEEEQPFVVHEEDKHQIDAKHNQRGDSKAWEAQVDQDWESEFNNPSPEYKKTIGQYESLSGKKLRFNVDQMFQQELKLLAQLYVANKLAPEFQIPEILVRRTEAAYMTKLSAFWTRDDMNHVEDELKKLKGPGAKAFASEVRQIIADRRKGLGAVNLQFATPTLEQAKEMYKSAVEQGTISPDLKDAQIIAWARRLRGLGLKKRKSGDL